MGLLSATIWVAEPKLTVGMSDWTYVSAEEVKVRVVGGVGVLTVVGRTDLVHVAALSTRQISSTFS